MTRRLVNVRSHMMFRPELINILYLIVNQMTIQQKKIFEFKKIVTQSNH